MGIRDEQPPSYFQKTLNRTRVKTSEHVCKHERTKARKERAYARGGMRPKGDS